MPLVKKKTEVKLKRSDEVAWVIKYRPRRIEDYVGQPGAVAMVKGMFSKASPPRTILISGPTGRGKTTLARIMSSHFNGVPADQDVDYHELNLTVDRGIDDIRALGQKVRFLPRRNYAVYVLDEIQGLTPQGQEALLKLIEEPPKHVIFFLCTNEPENVKPTILGRCKKITLAHSFPDQIVPLLERVNKAEKCGFGPKFLLKIAELADGQSREAVQILEAAHDIRVGDPNMELKDVMENALQQAGGSINADSVAIKLILSMYAKSRMSALKTMNDTQEHIAVLNKALELHRYFIDLQTGTRTYQSYNRQLLLKEMKKIVKGEPNLAHTMMVQSYLTQMKLKLNMNKILTAHQTLIWVLHDFFKELKTQKA